MKSKAVKASCDLQNKHVVESFGERLLSALVRRQMSRQQLADASGVSVDAIHKLSRSERSPNLKSVAALATSLEMTIPELLTGRA